MNQDRIKMFELVELAINSTNPGRFNFVTQPQLRNQGDQVIIIKGIQVYTDEVYVNSQTDPTVPGMPAADMAKAVLVLYVNGEESLHYIPLAQLNNINGTAPYQQEIQGLADLMMVSWEKSYVQFSVAPSKVMAIPFGVTYLRLQKDPAREGHFILAQ